MSEQITKPLLAATLEKPSDLSFLDQNYYLCTPKLDGIRALKINGKLVSRTFKSIRNDFIRNELEKILPDNADGEIIVGNNFQETTSAVMRKEGQPKFTYYWFDFVSDKLGDNYMRRINALQSYNTKDDSRIVKLIPQMILSLEGFNKFESECIDKGFEGVILRNPWGRYKCGRSTAREGILLKSKRFSDGEATIIGFVEGEHNLNEAKKDNFGRTERSSAKEGKVKSDTLGKFLLRDIVTNVEFGCGTGKGLTAEIRKDIWDNRNEHLGKIVKYKHFAITGVKNKPRLPIFLGFRDKDDM